MLETLRKILMSSPTPDEPLTARSLESLITQAVMAERRERMREVMYEDLITAQCTDPNG